jgi:GNAT superfamily N-acetyltransferase
VFSLRAMKPDEWNEVAALIHDSTNAWYQAHGRSRIFGGPKDDALLFCQVYERLDPGCCVVAADSVQGRLAGSCFYHPRPTHVSLGIMNVHPDYFGRGVARRLLQFITDLADAQGKPLRLVSSVSNLDSFSLYSRGGFVPRLVYQDLTLRVPEAGLPVAVAGGERVRAAALDDVPAMAALEWEVNHIRREDDLRYFVENPNGLWHVSVLDSDRGGLDGFLVSIAHPAWNMLGPGIMRTEEQAQVLIHAELNQRRGCQLLWLVPASCARLVQTMYAWGAVNCDLHFAQARGPWTPPDGVVMPTFMPETG